MNQHNVKETKEVLGFVVPFANSLDLPLQDGFQWFKDLLSLLPASMKLPAAIEGIDQVPAEIDDLDHEERQELFNMIAELNFDSDGSEEITERALQTAIAVARLVESVRKWRKDKL